ncbi:hypothetical protein RB653_010025 [Dictyostelium firmibasis]|uniref:Uncharacterized protein n=1 Tax=Dictyostelium firmibasis TaxID=79012 RepID=A0AAN7TJI0_9MYCE
MTIISSISSLGKISNNKNQNNFNTNNIKSINNPNIIQGSNENTRLISGVLELVGGLSIVLGFVVGALGL